MVRAIITWSLHNRLIVLLGTLVVIIAGIYSGLHLNVEAYPDPTPPENWVAAMTAIARDEVEHLAVVCRLLAHRGARLTRQHSNPYASALRQLVAKGAGPAELVDRLMVSALIEARSCERFKLLADVCEDAELASSTAACGPANTGTTEPLFSLPNRSKNVS